MMVTAPDLDLPEDWQARHHRCVAIGSRSAAEVGDPVAAIHVEGALHNIMAPKKGRLRIACHLNSLVESGSVIRKIAQLN